MNPATEQHSGIASSSAVVSPILKHLAKVPGEQWAFWRWICLRGAGFPSDLPQQLAAPEEVISAAAAVVEAEEAAALDRQKAIQQVNAALDKLREENQWNDKQRRVPLLNARHRLNSREAPKQTPEITGLEGIARFHDALGKVHAARVFFCEQFAASSARTSQIVREIAASPRFREAVMWQNRHAVLTALDPLLRKSSDHLRNSDLREKEQLVANYIQRYSVKNDTVGFFGPVGWARLVSNKGHLRVRPGSSLVAKSTVYFENWCIESLADKMSTIKSLRPWIAPRLLPFFRVEGAFLYSSGPVCELSPLHAAILQRCNGESTAREIARAAIAIPECAVRTEGQVYGILQAYLARGIISWSFELPYCLHPEKKLRELLQRIERIELRDPLLKELAELERGREKISGAIGDPETLDLALKELDVTFTRLTSRSPTKSAGAMYASRTLVYQDCQRAVNVEIGPETIAALGAPLSLVLSSVRWFSYQAAALFRGEFRNIYEELAQNGQHTKVDMLQFWARVEPLIFDPVRKLFNGVVPEFQTRWEAILQVPWAERRVEYISAKLKPLVESLFAISGAGWHLARYHSPDVMIAAPNVDAIRHGECIFVLGEVHMATNTLRYSFAVSQHDREEELFEAIEADLPQNRVVTVPPRHWPRVTNRTSLALVSPRDLCLEVASVPVANAPRSRVVPISSFAVEPCDGGLVVRSWDGNLKFDIIEFFGELLSLAAIELIKIVRPRNHVPRITIDKLVVVRESWSFPVSELEFIRPKEENERYLQVRRWMRNYGLPRFVFVRVPVEVKPLYLDFDSPIYVEIFIKMIRRMLADDREEGRVTLTEMLPTPEQVWLPDADGRSYTSELRMVAWDLAQQAPSRFAGGERCSCDDSGLDQSIQQ